MGNPKPYPWEVALALTYPLVTNTLLNAIHAFSQIEGTLYRVGSVAGAVITATLCLYIACRLLKLSPRVFGFSVTFVALFFYYLYHPENPAQVLLATFQDFASTVNMIVIVFVPSLIVAAVEYRRLDS